MALAAPCCVNSTGVDEMEQFRFGFHPLLSYANGMLTVEAA